MKKSKLIKISENLEKSLKESLDSINELIQASKKPSWTLTDAYSRVSSALSDIQGLLNDEIHRDRKVDDVYGFNYNVFDLEEDGGEE
jgi:hypothetical protein